MAAAQSYQNLTQVGLPFPYCFLVLPLVLHAETRGNLPTTLATKLVTWTERHGDIVAGFPTRLEELKPYTSEAILLVTRVGFASLSESAALIVTPPKGLGKLGQKSGSREVEDIIKKSDFVGKWLAAAGTPATVFTALGVRLDRHSS